MKRVSRREVGERWALGVLLAGACAACEPGQSADDADDGGSSGGASDACTVSPGDYLATFTPVSDNCGGVEALPSERFSISTEGEILSGGGRAIGDGSAPSGCVDDDASTDGCVVSFTRECATELLLFGAADVVGDYTLDFDAGSGSVDIGIGVYDGSTLLQSCQGEQRVSIRSR